MKQSNSYEAFLASKVLVAAETGVDISDIHPFLFPFQKAVVQWALKKGRAALFLDTGLGKTVCQLEYARHVPGKTLILAPLAVAHQTVREGKKIDLEVTYVRTQEQADAAGKVVITNYDMLDAFTPDEFTGIVLDESSILKGFASKTRQTLIQRFSDTPFKLACTATPAPNDHMELGNHAEFLGIMPGQEVLARWFQHDSGDTGTYRLKRHAEADFWRWVAGWAVCARKPSDVGPYEDELYNLPPLVFKTETVVAPEIAEGRGQLFAAGSAPSATSMWKEKGETAKARCERTAEIVGAKSDTPWIVWCDTNEESALLSKLIPDAVEVKGSDSLQTKEARLDAFATGQARILITKAKIAGWGLNFQHCSNVIFTGLSYSFESLFQAVRRTWRFGQTEPVTAHLVTADSEIGILESLERKKRDHEKMQDAMVAATKQYGIGGEKDRTLRKIEPQKFEGPDWELYLGDCVEVLKGRKDNSVHLTVTSPPFSNLFCYSDALQDMGNCANHDEFFEHMDHLVPELLRVTKPGRLAAIHCSDLPIHKHQAGVMGLYDFPGDLVKSFEKHGWVLHSKITIWKDPVVEVTRTKSLGLLHKTFETRREAVRVGMADYMLIFRKWTPDMEDKQISGLAPTDSYIGDNPPPPNGDQRSESIEIWQKYASPVWMDINQTRVLNNYREGRNEEDSKHICPLQLDVIERCIWLWSNEGDTVLDPFMGIGSTGYSALKMNRKTIGTELKEGYANVAIKNFESVLAGRLQGALVPLVNSAVEGAIEAIKQ